MAVPSEVELRVLHNRQPAQEDPTAPAHPIWTSAALRFECRWLTERRRRPPPQDFTRDGFDLRNMRQVCEGRHPLRADYFVKLTAGSVETIWMQDGGEDEYLQALQPRVSLRARSGVPGLTM